MTRFTHNGKYLSFDGLQIMIPKKTLRTGLIAEYLFNGNADDTSGSGYNGTSVNNPTLVADRNGVPNSAYDFNGIDQYIDIQGVDLNDIFNNNFTVSVWFKQNIQNTNKNIFTYRDAYQDGFRVAIDPINYLDLQYNSMWVFGGPYTSTGWTHVLGVRNGYSLSLYINNILVKTENISSQPPINVTNNLKFATDSTKNSGEFNGSLDNIRIYDRFLSPEEITQLYNE